MRCERNNDVTVSFLLERSRYLEHGPSFTEVPSFSAFRTKRPDTIPNMRTTENVQDIVSVADELKTVQTPCFAEVDARNYS
jgi:hypothetical protein